MIKFNRQINLTTLGYMILGIIITFLLAGLYTFFKVGEFSEDLAYQNALQESKRYAETLKSFRSLYTSEVIAEVIERKQMKITHDYKDMKYDSTGAIPLPATLSMMLADKMTASNTVVKLYSKYPFPWRRGRQLTEFETKAFERFEANRNSDSAYYEFDKDKGVVRYAIPDKMVTMSCVNCHNNHPKSPKVGWALGDVRGAISIVKPVNATIVTEAASGTFMVMAIIAVFVLLGLWIVISRIGSVRDAIDQTKSTIEQMKLGDLPENNAVPPNEMGDVVQGLNTLKENLKNVAAFAQSVGKGNLTTQFQKLSEKDSLGIALIDMRNNLQKISEEDRIRNWASTGLAELGDTIRSSRHTKTTELYDKLIRFLVRYIEFNQGAMILVNGETDDEFLELTACYAYDKKRFVEKRIELEEGLVGQCFLEKQTILITRVPKSYVKITSGLGEAVPDCLLLVPLKNNDSIYGVIELLSFNRIEPYVIEFAEKAAQNIASVIASGKINDRTQRLLEQTQQHTAEIKTRENELLQNMEELAATQEEMMRKEGDYVRRIKELTDELHSVSAGS